MDKETRDIKQGEEKVSQEIFAIIKEMKTSQEIEQYLIKEEYSCEKEWKQPIRFKKGDNEILLNWMKYANSKGSILLEDIEKTKWKEKWSFSEISEKGIPEKCPKWGSEDIYLRSKRKNEHGYNRKGNR